LSEKDLFQMSYRKKNGARTEEAELQALLELSKRPPTWDEVQETRKWMRSQSNRSAVTQISRATPTGNSALVDAAGFYGSFVPSDGNESALARLMVAASNGAMDCFARAATSDSPYRVLELNLAIKLSATVAILSKALDSHRGAGLPDFIDDKVESGPVRRSLVSAEDGCPPQLPNEKLKPTK
jgi:hypothetical protein